MLTEGDHRFAAGVAVLEAGGLEPAVVHAPPEAKLVEHLGRDGDPESAGYSRRQRGSPGRKDRHVGLAEQPGHLRQRQHAVGRHVEDARQPALDHVLQRVDDVVLVDELVAGIESEDHRHGRQGEEIDVRGGHVRAEDVCEPQDGYRDVGVSVRELRHRRLGLEDVALDRSPRCVGSPIVSSKNAGSSCSDP